MTPRPAVLAIALGMSLVAGAAAGCSGSGATPPAAPPTSQATPSSMPSPAPTAPTAPATPRPATPTDTPAPTGPTTFTSPLYGYTVTIPAGWKAVGALLAWDGASSPGHSDATVDKLIGPASAAVFVYAAPESGDLAAFAKSTIAWNVRDHGDTCPQTAPSKTETIQIGGAPGVLQLWDCGILVDLALTVHNGVGYTFFLRDPAIATAVDPADRAVLDAMLATVVFPS